MGEIDIYNLVASLKTCFQSKDLQYEAVVERSATVLGSADKERRQWEWKISTAIKQGGCTHCKS